MREISVRRVDFGWFVRPGEETGNGLARVEPTLGYLIDHPDGPILVDTGMGHHPYVEEHYRPRRVPLGAALAAAGTTIAGIRYVVNCHLHFDHCGGNPELPGVPVFTQRAELAAARSVEHYTLPELIDHRGARYEELDGAAEILPGVRIMPTPGHTAGHQSVVVRTSDGTVIVAGQSHDHASAFTYDALAHKAVAGAAGEEPGAVGKATGTTRGGAEVTREEAGTARGEAEVTRGEAGTAREEAEVTRGEAGTGGGHAVEAPPAWVGAMLALDPRRVVFAHDNAVWTP